MKNFKKLISLLTAFVLSVGLFAALGTVDVSAATTKPAKPTFKAKVLSSGTVKITIDKNENAQGYAIFIKGENDDEYSKAKTIAKDGYKKRVVTLTKLTTGEYSIRVRAYRKKSKSSKEYIWSDFSAIKKVNVVDKQTKAWNARMNELVAEKYPDIYPLVESGKIKVKMEADSSIYIVFGSYDMIDQNKNKDDKKEPLEWKIVEYDEDNSRVLLLSRYIIDLQPINDNNEPEVTWENCTLRNWLNTTFLAEAFSDKQQKMILKADLRNIDKNSYGVSSGENTKDRIFLLNYDDVTNYKCFSAEKALLATRYDGSEYVWWLRSKGNGTIKFQYIRENGTIDAGGSYYYSSSSSSPVNILGVRPALYLSLK